MSNLRLLQFSIIPTVWAVALCIRALSSPLRPIPGPWHTHFVNWPLKWYTICGKRIYFIDALHQKYGKIVRIAPGEVSVATPGAYKQIYSVTSKFTKHEWYQWFSGHDVPAMFTMTNIKEHAARRKVFARAFRKSQLRANWEPQIQKIANLAVLRIAEALDESGRTDIFEWFRFMASDSSGMLMFGDNFHSLETGETHHIIKTISVYLIGAGVGAELSWIPFLAKIIPSSRLHDLFNGWNSVLQYANLAVENSRGQRYGTGKTIFGDIIEQAEKSDKLSDDEIRNEAGNFTVAGTDTTATTITYSIYAALLHPDIQKQLEAEVDTLPDGYNDDDVEKLPLLNATIKEAGRLYGAVQGWYPRVVPEGGAMIEGFLLPQGTTVGAQGYTLYRDPDIFPNPNEFVPSRWFPESSMSAEAKIVYNPFGPGSRVCLGKHLAEMETRLAVAAFFRKCKGAALAPETTPESMEFLNFFATFPKGDKCIIQT